MLRLLLDHNFQAAQFDVHTLDRTVRYEQLVDWRPDFAERSTPDWVIHLQAYVDGFDGIVTSDWHQLEQAEEVIALEQTRLSVITWRKGMNDPIQQWGSLLLYMPMIRQRIEQDGPSIIRLPVPQLQPDSRESTSGVSYRYAMEKAKVKRPTLVKEVVPDMIDELEERDLTDLIPVLQKRPPRKKAAPTKAAAAKKAT